MNERLASVVSPTPTRFVALGRIAHRAAFRRGYGRSSPSACGVVREGRVVGRRRVERLEACMICFPEGSL